MAVVNDRKIPRLNNKDSLVYEPDIISSNDYYPFGMLEPGRNFNSSSYNYGFNGKIKDDEAYGSGNEYDFGARIYDSRLGRWLACDPLETKYPDLSPYDFVDNNPINQIDPDGKRIIFVNGALAGGADPAPTYWDGAVNDNGDGSPFIEGAKKFLHDKDVTMVHYDPPLLSSAAERYLAGHKYAEDHFKELTQGMDKDKDSFKLVAHSMGAAFSEGMADYIKTQGYKVEMVVNIEAYQAADISKSGGPNKDGTSTYTVDYQLTDDPVLKLPPTAKPGMIKNADIHMQELSDPKDNTDRHVQPIWGPTLGGQNFWDNLGQAIDMQKDAESYKYDPGAITPAVLPKNGSGSPPPSNGTTVPASKTPKPTKSSKPSPPNQSKPKGTTNSFL